MGSPWEGRCCSLGLPYFTHGWHYGRDPITHFTDEEAGERLWFTIVIPIWMLLVAELGVIFVTRRRAPRSPTACPCGYDLTGNVSGTCPECGRKAKARPTPPSVTETARIRITQFGPDNKTRPVRSIARSQHLVTESP